MLPVISLGHGGGPIPLMNTEKQSIFSTGDVTSTFAKELKNVWPTLFGSGAFETPKGILVISAHWESEKAGIVEVLDIPQNSNLLFDYYGFPSEQYKLRYDCPIDPKLNDKVIKALSDAGFQAKKTKRQGFDHGVFVPLKLIHPEATIPVAQMSLDASLDPELHIKIGKSLSKLREEGILIIASGLSVHNLRERHPSSDENFAVKWAKDFQSWFDSVFADSKKASKEIENGLIHWVEMSPNARKAHPTAEHFVPFFVAAGAGNLKPAKKQFQTWMAGTFSLNLYYHF